MIRKIVYLLLFTLFASAISAETLSEKSKISLLTCGAGEDVYAQFGHTALRVQDPSLNFDVAFNYGTFNFRTPNFYLKFVKGITDYELGIDFAMQFFLKYNERGIPVWEQDLNLTLPEKQALFDALMLNYEPQNRFYRYNFIYDNCATRPLDMIVGAVGANLKYQPLTQDKTLRDLLEQCLGSDTWIKLGIDIVIGAPADKIASFRERMFLPSELMTALQTAKRADGANVVSAKRVAIDLPLREPISPMVTPLIAALAFMLLVVMGTYIWRNKCMLWLDAILFTVAGLIGVVIFYLNFYSVHPIVSPNYNLFWLQPFYLLFVLMLPFKKTYKLLSYMQMLFALLILISIGGYIYFPQKFNLAFMPLMISLLIRSVHFVRMQEVFQNKKPV